MSYTVPYTFVPGTKARAQEVNANFSAIIDALDDADTRKANTDFSNISTEAIDIIKNNSSIRNLGELVFSPIPLTDSCLHLLDGSILQKQGIYEDFVSYLANKYNTDISYNSDLYSVMGSPTITNDGIAGSFSLNDYVKIESSITLGEDFELYLPFTPVDNTGTTEIYRAMSNNVFRFLANQSSGGVVFNMTDGTNSLGTPAIIPKENIVPGDTYVLVIKQKNQTCSYGYIHDGLYTQTGTKTNYPLNLPSFNNIMIGRGANIKFNGTIDLKQFKIVINNEEVINGSKINNYFTDEESWQQSVSQYGECAKFVYNSVNNTIRLPKIKGLIEYTTSTSDLGELTEAGLPNITGFVDKMCTYSSSSPTGAFYQTSSETWRKAGTDQTLYQKDVHFDASHSSSVYGKSATVQPQTVKYLVYIVVASTPKTSIQVDIDQIATDLNEKLDKDLSNIEISNIRNFDGQWTYKYILINNSNVSAGKYDVDLSSYLPNDQNKYEVIVNIYATQNSSTANSFVILSSSLITESGTSGTFSCLAVNSNSTVSGTQTIFPVGNNKILSYRLGGQNFDAIFIRLYGYRRIGTNN